MLLPVDIQFRSEVKMRTTVALVTSAVILAGCGGPSAATHTPTPTVQAQASTDPALLQCRLPVAGFVPAGAKGAPNNSAGSDGQPNQKGTGGFFDLRSRTYTPVADSDRSYLAATNAWLPVVPQAIAADQSSYIEGRAQTGASTAPPTTTLYIVDVRTKARRLLFTAPNGDMAVVLAYANTGVYVETLSSTGPGPSALVLIDPVTVSHHSVPGSQLKKGVFQQAWIAISGDAVWGNAITFPNGQSKPYVDTLVRLDLNTGAAAGWYSSKSAFTVAGFDTANHPILAIFGSSASQGVTTSLALVSAPNKPVAIEPQGGTFVQGLGQGFSDSHGTWFGSSDGSVWLYTASRGMQKMGSVPPQRGGNGGPYDQHAWRSIAGPCA
jgi:hypothetical protein